MTLHGAYELDWPVCSRCNERASEVTEVIGGHVCDTILDGCKDQLPQCAGCNELFVGPEASKHGIKPLCSECEPAVVGYCMTGGHAIFRGDSSGGDELDRQWHRDHCTTANNNSEAINGPVAG